MSPRRPGAAPSALVISAALVTTLALAGCSTHSDTAGPGGDGTNDTALTKTGGLLEKPISAPVLSGPTIGGGTVSTASYRGSVVVVNFYASWCGPCRAETPLLVQTAKADPAVRFLGVVTQDSAADGAAFRQTYGVTYPSLVDPDGTYLAKFRKISPAGLPVTLVLNKQGQVAARYVGGISVGSNLQAVLAKLQGEVA